MEEGDRVGVKQENIGDEGDEVMPVGVNFPDPGGEDEPGEFDSRHEE